MALTSHLHSVSVTALNDTHHQCPFMAIQSRAFPPLSLWFSTSNNGGDGFNVYLTSLSNTVSLCVLLLNVPFIPSQSFSCLDGKKWYPSPRLLHCDLQRRCLKAFLALWLSHREDDLISYILASTGWNKLLPEEKGGREREAVVLRGDGIISNDFFCR